jgi:hypothetical protein
MAEHRGCEKSHFSDPMRKRQFDYLTGIVRIATAHDRHLTLLIYPYHAEYPDILRDVRLWSDFEERNAPSWR